MPTHTSIDSNIHRAISADGTEIAGRAPREALTVTDRMRVLSLPASARY